MPWFIRSMFYRLPKRGDIYVFDEPINRDPWGCKPPHEVEVLDAKCGWVRYSFCGGWLFKDQRLPRGIFHGCYRKRQNPSVEGRP